MMSPTVPVFTGTVSNPYPHYTTCVEAADYDPENQYVQMAMAGIFAGGVAFIIAAITTATPWCYLAAAGITLIAAGLAYCNWWLTDRLICLPADVSDTTGPAADVCAVGMFVNEDQTDPAAWPFDLPDLDTDWTMDILLYGTEPSDTSVNILIGETDAISSLGLGFENGARERPPATSSAARDRRRRAGRAGRGGRDPGHRAHTVRHPGLAGVAPVAGGLLRLGDRPS
jgi:hypothetical protein